MRCAKVRLAAVVLTVALAACAASAGWEEALSELLSTGEGADVEAAVRSVVRANPDWRDIADLIEAGEFPASDSTGEAVLRSTVCVDSVERPWVIVVPAAYDPTVSTPLLVVLHGGVGTADVFDDALGYARTNEFGAAAAERGWFALFPFGQAGATWWDDVGMANIRNLVRTVKREFNIDDDRVWLAGFSDGASGAFAHAMLAPSDYAAFIAFNGHMGVASLDGELPTYAPNMAATPVFATTTFDDALYPSRKMRATIEMAREAGADILYREFPGGHNFDDVAGVLPAAFRFLERHPRDPLPAQIVWEAGDTRFGACRWFAIDRITADEPAPWHVDHNVALLDERVTIGFQPDYGFEGPGVRVELLPEGDHPARRIGLQVDDIIVRADATRIDSLPDLGAWKSGVARGDSFEMAVIRDRREVLLRGELPEPAGYFVFKRDVPSALARVSYAANRVDVETSRVGAFKVLVHPDMVALDQNLVIAVNGEAVFDELVEPDVGFMLSDFVRNRDRRLLYVAQVEVELP